MDPLINFSSFVFYQQCHVEFVLKVLLSPIQVIRKKEELSNNFTVDLRSYKSIFEEIISTKVFYFGVVEIFKNSIRDFKMPDKYNVDMTLGDLLKDPVSEKFLRSLPGFGEALDNPQLQQAMGFSLRMLQQYSEQMSPGQFSKEQLEQIDAGLKML